MALTLFAAAPACFSYDPSKNGVSGMFPDGPDVDDRPNTFAFGTFTGDPEEAADRCRQECEKEPLCWVYA